MKHSIILILLLFSVKIIFAQNILLTGIVVDEMETPLPGVSVYIEGATTGTITNLDGKFELSVDKSVAKKISFSFIGYEKQTKEIQDNLNYFEINLIPSANEIEDVIVIGYGTQRRGDVTVSISSVNTEDISSPAVTSLDQTLQGLAAGVVVNQSSGKPGAPVSIRIRGTSSINGTNEPLYVVDGIPIITSAEDLTSGTIQGSDINPLSSINPNDIESLQILKDASATAIYGARGANGVILITTKKGIKNGLQVSLNSTVGFQKLSNKLDLLNAYELAVLGNDAVTEARKYYPDVAYNPAFALPERFGEGTDWQDEIFRTAFMTNQQLSVRGGSEKSTFFISGNLVSQEGIINNSDFKKGTFRINLENELSKSVKLGVNLNFTHSANNGVITGIPNVSSSVTAMSMFFNPGQEVYDPDHISGYTYESNTMNKIPNPVAEINETERILTSDRALGDLSFDWDITGSLQYKLKVGIDAFFNKEQQFIPSYIRRGQDKGKGYNLNMQGYTWLVENTLTYKKDLDKHHFNLLGGYTMQKYVSEVTDIAVERFDDNRLGYYQLGIALDKTLGTGFSSWSMLSGIGRIIYNYNTKYYLTFSGRLDGSSKFGKSNRFGFFPSLSTAWRVSSEKFMEPLTVINDLKLRLSAGTVGNEGIPSGTTLSRLGNLPYFFGESGTSKVIGTYVYSLQNEDLKWEVTKQYDIGIDLSMFKSRITFTAESYLKNTSDLLLFIPINRSSGFYYAWSNIGDMQNKGLEFSLNTVNFDGKFKWQTMFNLSFNRNEVTNLDKSESIFGTPVMNIVDWTVITEGKPVGVIYGYKSDGIIQLNEDPSEVPFFPSKTPRHGDRKYVDRNGDGNLTVDDYFELGQVNPDFSFGFKNTFSYKQFTLDVYIQGDYGNKIVNFNRFQLESFDGFQNNSAVALEHWTENNPSNEYPRVNAAPHGIVMSDAIVEDGSYARLREVVLSYSFSSKLLQPIKISSLRFSVSGRNLYTLTNYSGYDPEVSIYGGSVFGKGADYGAYPMSKTILFSINATF